MFNNFSENSSVYETMSKNVVEPEKPQTTSQYETYALHAGLERRYVLIRTHMPTHPDTHMHARARTHTHKYVILTAFPRQQWFRERASLLRYTYIASCYYYFGPKRVNVRSLETSNNLTCI